MKTGYIARFLGLLLVLAALVVGGCATTGESSGSGSRYPQGNAPAWQMISPPGT